MGKLIHKQNCIVCDKMFTSPQTGTKYCSNACRQKMWRQRRNGTMKELRNSLTELRNSEQELRNSVTMSNPVIQRVLDKGGKIIVKVDDEHQDIVYCKCENCGCTDKPVAHYFNGWVYIATVCDDCVPDVEDKCYGTELIMSPDGYLPPKSKGL